MGRPPKPEGEKYRTTQRQFGRIPDDEWAILLAAAKAEGMSFTQWAKQILLQAAKHKQT
jgi:predicted HicB family RNase H-like nuclease